MVSCSVYGCSNRSKLKNKKPGVTFHSFPLNPERRAQWIQAVNRKNWYPSSHAKICSIHFKEEDLDRTSLSCVRVRENAVPSFCPEFPSNEQPIEKILIDAPCKRETSSESYTVEHSLFMSEMVPSTSRDINDDEPLMAMDGLKVLENIPAIYRNLLAEKDRAIEERDEIIASYIKKLASRDKCITRIRQKLYRAKRPDK